MIADGTPLERIPQAAPGLRFDRFRDDIDRAIRDCLAEGRFVGGPEIARFEDGLAGYLKVRHVVSCNSCTDALFLSLRALGIGSGDEVIVPTLTAAGTAMAVIRAGATPRFADVDRRTRSIDVDTIRQSMSARVRAVIVVHLHGIPADLDPISRLAKAENIHVIEDCAQAAGTRYNGRAVGTFGTFGAFSFYPTKNLGCMGDGGAVATNDTMLAETVRSMANYGWNADRESVLEGTNSRLDEIQAAVLNILLPHLEAGNAERVAAAERYDAIVKGSKIQGPAAVPGAVYHQYAVESDDRDTLVRRLSDCGIGSAFHYKRGLHREPFFRQFCHAGVEFPSADMLADRMLSLPIQPELMTGQGRIVEALQEFISE